MTVEAHSIEVYKDAAGYWRWRARDTNGRIVADSGEGYERLDYTIQAATDLFPQANIRQAPADESREDAEATEGTGSSS